MRRKRTPMSTEVPIHLRQQIETNLDFRTAVVSSVIVVATLIAMALAEKLFGLTQRLP
jgi:ABC-type spermidine/putrescine transport system permease subunit II